MYEHHIPQELQCCKFHRNVDISNVDKNRLIYNILGVNMEKNFKNKEDIVEWHKTKIAETGWVAHLVIGKGSHTHGLKEHFGIPDLEIAVELPKETTGLILSNVIEFLCKKEYELNTNIPNILQDMDVMLITSPEDENNLRIILPDVNGCLEENKMVNGFGTQFKKSIQ